MAPKVSRLWIRDTKGFPSISVTLLMVAFTVTTLAYIGSVFASIGPVTFRSFDVSACATYFVPIMAHYWGRKYTDSKIGAPVVIVPPPSASDVNVAVSVDKGISQ